MAYEIVERELTARPVVVAQRTVPHTGIAQALTEVLPLLFQFAARHGLTLGGRPFIRYLEISGDSFTLEPGMAVTAGTPPAAGDAASGVTCTTLPAGPAATTLHVGPYERLGGAYRAIEQWIAANHRTPAGAPWEDYITDPGTTRDPNQYETAIAWPLVPASGIAGGGPAPGPGSAADA